MERNYFKSLTDEERRQLKQNIFQRLEISDETEVPKVFLWKRALSIGIAASLIAAVGLLIFGTNHSKRSEKVILASTKAGEVKQILLADSSVVILNPGSALYSTSDFSTTNRVVFLEGNGFFKVKKLESRQRFVVHANDVEITVLGTQFNVNARSEQVEVALASGSVQVKEDGKDKHPEFMVPGDKLKLDHRNGTFERSQIDPALYSPWIKGEWDFKNTPLSEIAILIKDYYGTTVIFNKERTKDLRITAVIPVTNIQGLMKVIGETLPVEISENNQQLFIQ